MSQPFIESYALTISTLGPVHVGANEDYDPTNYVIDEQALYEFDGAAATRALPDVARKRLLSITERRGAAEMLTQVQGLFYENRQHLIVDSSHVLRVGKSVAETYAQRIGRPAAREADGRAVVNQLEIERTAYDRVTRFPVLPGTSLKGAMRTALLDRVNNGKDLIRRDEKSQALQQRLFQYDMRSLSKDPMRLVSLSDAHFDPRDDLYGSEVLHAVNRKRAPVTDKQGRLRKSSAEQKGLAQLLECVPAMRWRQFAGTLALNRVGAVRGRGEALPAPALRWAVQDMAAACNRYYRPQLDEELELLAERGYASEQWMCDVRAVLRGFEDEFKSDAAFLLRVGRHSGAQAVTLNGVRSIKIMRGKDEAGRNRSDYLAAPKTIWLAAASQEASGGLLPFGWVIVELCPAGRAPAALPNAADTMAKCSNAGREWSRAQAERHEMLRAESDAQEQRRRERRAQEEQDRQRAEAAAREESERLAAMSPLERELHDLARQEPSTKAYMVWLRHLDEGKWEGEQAKVVAEHCKKAMQEQNAWREESKKKRPEKDKPYQATCRVKQFL